MDMTEHATGTREEWLAARLELLEAEKELTRRGDELAKRGHPEPRERLRVRAVDHQLKLSGHDHSQRWAFSSLSEPGPIGSAQDSRPAGSRITHQACTFCTRPAPGRPSRGHFGVQIAGMNVRVDDGDPAEIQPG
jgi:hypothetical protein